MSNAPHRSISAGLIGALVAGLALVVGLVSLTLAGQAGSSSLNSIEDSGGGYGGEDRRIYGTIIVGEVISATGEERQRWGPEDSPNLVLFYDFKISRTLRGDAKGQISITYYGADSNTIDAPNPGPLKVGSRYLISAGALLEDGTYPVNAGPAVIPIDSDEEEAQLIAEFEQLIPAAEKEEREALAQSRAWAERTPAEHAPVVLAEPLEGPAGSTITVTGAYFLPPQVLVTWDDDRNIGDAMVQADGQFTQQVTVPRSAKPGQHHIVVYGSEDQRVEIEFRVTD